MFKFITVCWHFLTVKNLPQLENMTAAIFRVTQPCCLQQHHKAKLKTVQHYPDLGIELSDIKLSAYKTLVRPHLECTLAVV